MARIGVSWQWFLHWELLSGESFTQQSTSGEQRSQSSVWNKMCCVMGSNAMQAPFGLWRLALGWDVGFWCGLGKEEMGGVGEALLSRYVVSRLIG